jgi:DNA-binding MarR family transcriptional regulator
MSPFGIGVMSGRLDQALVALRQILRATEVSSRALAKQCGLTPSQLIMMQIIHSWGGASPGYIARELSLSHATVTALIDKLEARGLVYRERNEEDRRKVYAKLTAAGETVLDEAPDSLQQQFQSGFAKLEDWEQSMLIASLEKIVSLLHAEKLDASPVLNITSTPELVESGEA